MTISTFNDSQVRRGDLDLNGERDIKEIASFPQTAQRIFLNDLSLIHI